MIVAFYCEIDIHSFIQPVHKKVIKIKKWLALNLPLDSLFFSVS